MFLFITGRGAEKIPGTHPEATLAIFKRRPFCSKSSNCPAGDPLSASAKSRSKAFSVVVNSSSLMETSMDLLAAF